MFYRLNGTPEIDAVLMSSDARKRGKNVSMLSVCVCVLGSLCDGMRIRVCGCQCVRFKWARVRDSRMQMKPLKSGSFPLYLKGHPFLYLEHHFDISPTEARPYGALVLSGAL